MKVIIRDPGRVLFQNYITEEEMNAGQRLRLRRLVIEHLRTRVGFKWANHPKEYTHLLYYAELDGVAYVYTNGYLMTEQEFDHNVAYRWGIGQVGAIHRLV